MPWAGGWRSSWVGGWLGPLSIAANYSTRFYGRSYTKSALYGTIAVFSKTTSRTYVSANIFATGSMNLSVYGSSKLRSSVIAVGQAATNFTGRSTYGAFPHSGMPSSTRFYSVSQISSTMVAKAFASTSFYGYSRISAFPLPKLFASCIFVSSARFSNNITAKANIPGIAFASKSLVSNGLLGVIGSQTSFDGRSYIYTGGYGVKLYAPVSSMPIIVDIFYLPVTSDCDSRIWPTGLLDSDFDSTEEGEEDVGQIHRIPYEINLYDRKAIPLKLRKAGSRDQLNLLTSTFYVRAKNPLYTPIADIPIDLLHPETDLANGIIILSVDTSNVSGMAGDWDLEVVMENVPESRVVLYIKLSVLDP